VVIVSLLLLGAAYLAGCAGSSGNNAALNNATAGYDSSGALSTSAAAGSDPSAFAPTAASAGTANVAAVQAAEKLTAVAKPGNSAYKIGPLDVLDISVFKVPDLNKSVQVAEGGPAASAGFLQGDILVNSLGIYEPKAFFDIEDADWSKIEIEMAPVTEEYLTKDGDYYTGGSQSIRNDGDAFAEAGAAADAVSALVNLGYRRAEALGAVAAAARRPGDEAARGALIRAGLQGLGQAA